MQALAASHPDIVPADVLALEAGRGLRAAECATLLDGWLRRLARQEARARRVLGRLARGFLRRRHHHDLGFARLRDYTRERLGLSARELQALAHVVEGLARLPAIGDAFDNGDITWSQARCLVALATPEKARFWLLVARLHTVRALEAMVAHRAGRRVAGDTIDGEERVRVRLPCPRHVRARWGQGHGAGPLHVRQRAGALARGRGDRRRGAFGARRRGRRSAGGPAGPCTGACSRK